MSSEEIGGPLELIKYNKSMPGPSQYLVPSTLEKKSASFRPKLADLSLKYIKDVKLVIIDRSLAQAPIHFPRQLATGRKTPSSPSSALEVALEFLLLAVFLWTYALPPMRRRACRDQANVINAKCR